MQTEIISTLTVEGLHRWLGADELEYSYLKSYHRHEFEITATKKVSHNDRDIEIIQLSHHMREYMDGYYDKAYRCLSLEDRSCEHIAHELIAAFGLESCSVKEDGKMGAYVRLNKHENWAIVGRAGTGKSTLAERWYGDEWNKIEVSAIVKELIAAEGGHLFGGNKRVLRPDLASSIARAIKVGLRTSERNLIVGIRQPEIIDTLNLSNVIETTTSYREHDIDASAIDDKLGVDNIKANITLPWTII